MTNRPAIPTNIRREVLFEARHRCAVCGEPLPLELAHIVPWRKTQDHSIPNLIALCRNCHGRADKEKWGEDTLRRYKQEPWALSRNPMPPVSPDQKMLIDMIVATDPSQMKPDERLRLASMLAAFLDVRFEEVKVVSVSSANSSRVRISLPVQAAKRLTAAFNANDSSLKDFLDDIEVLDVQAVDDDTSIREISYQQHDVTKSGHVFISYSPRDGHAAAAVLENALHDHGYRVWRDIRGIDPAHDFTAEIEQAIEAASHMVVCITPDTLHDNSFVRREIQYALLTDFRRTQADKGTLPVIPLRFGDLDPHISIVNNEWVDYFKDSDNALSRIIEIVSGAAYPNREGKGAPDLFRAYLQNLYQYVVNYLDQTVISLIDLETEVTPDAVAPSTPAKPARRRDMVLEFYDATGLIAPEKEPAAPFKPKHYANSQQAFDQYDGRLLLLGEPGAGKTITLMAHARDAIAARLDDPTQPLPLLGLIATWNPDERTPFSEWLSRSEGLQSSDVQKTIESGKALLLFDGLNELGSQRPVDSDDPDGEQYDPRSRFMEHIPQNNQVLITCRVKDYTDIGVKVTLPGAITLQPLTDTQIKAYLNHVPDLLAAVGSDDELRYMLKTPLLLSLFAFAYQDMTQEDATQLRNLSQSPGELRATIINRYIDQRYAWEARRIHLQGHELAFTLEELRNVLGRVAMRKIEWGQENNVILRQDFETMLSGRQIEAFIELAIQVNILIPSEEETFRFIHFLVRDILAFPQFITALGDEDASIRVQSAALLERIEDERVVLPFILALSDKDVNVRLSAARALGRIGDKRTLPSLFDALYDEDDIVRSAVATALRQIGTQEALAAVEQWEKEQNQE